MDHPSHTCLTSARARPLVLRACCWQEPWCAPRGRASAPCSTPTSPRPPSPTPAPCARPAPTPRAVAAATASVCPFTRAPGPAPWAQHPAQAEASMSWCVLGGRRVGEGGGAAGAGGATRWGGRHGTEGEKAGARPPSSHHHCHSMLWPTSRHSAPFLTSFPVVTRTSIVPPPPPTHTHRAPK